MRLCESNNPSSRNRSFNPRTRAGCDCHSVSFSWIGASLSIHAPVQGATGLPMRKCSRKPTFNPRTRAGCDDAVQPDLSRAGRAFNPRTRAGCDKNNHQPAGRWLLFQSTHPCRVRLPSRGVPPQQSTFQSTHPCRVRRPGQARLPSRHPEHLSIHAPVQGATQRSMRWGRGATTFNPRTRAGCDGEHVNKVNWETGLSIHAPVQGATAAGQSERDDLPLSIHAPVQGATFQGRAPKIRGHMLSIHAPVQGATPSL